MSLSPKRTWTHISDITEFQWSGKKSRVIFDIINSGLSLPHFCWMWEEWSVFHIKRWVHYVFKFLSYRACISIAPNMQQMTEKEQLRMEWEELPVTNKREELKEMRQNNFFTILRQCMVTAATTCDGTSITCGRNVSRIFWLGRQKPLKRFFKYKRQQSI